MKKSQMFKRLVSEVKGLLWKLNRLYYLLFKKKVSLRKVEFNSEIPRKIHQIFISDSPIPQELEENMALLRQRNPEWQYTLYDGPMIVDYIKQNFPELLEFYLAINPNYKAARADFFRYLLMYNEGGCYMDVKSNFAGSLDDLADDSGSMLISHWANLPGQPFEGWGKFPELKNPRGEFMQCFIFAPKGHPFLKAVVERVIMQVQSYRRWLHGVGLNGVVRVTGPIVFTQAIEPIMELYPHKRVNFHEIGFVYSIYQNNPKGGHRKLYKHFSQLDESIVLPSSQSAA